MPPPAAATPSPTLQLDGLQARWADDPAAAPLFGPLQARLAPGLHWVQGDSGSGKTLLLRWLAGAAPAGLQVSGQALLAGRPLATGHGGAHAGCAWLDARDPAFDSLTPAQLRGHLAQAHPALDEAAWQRHIGGFQLAAHGFKTLHMLSTGMRRKAALAAVLASGAPVLLLDEPTAGLDAPSTAWLVAALKGLVAEAGPWVMLAAGALPDGLVPAGSLRLPGGG